LILQEEEERVSQRRSKEDEEDGDIMSIYQSINRIWI